MPQFVKLEEIQAGMVLSEPVQNNFGQVMIPKDFTIEEKHFRLLKLWNVVGIPEKDLPHIFEMFYRGSNVLHIPGAELGLSMVEHSINLSNRKINITSEENIRTDVFLEFSKNQ